METECRGCVTENSPYFTDKYQALRIYTKPVHFVCGKILCKNPLVKRMKQRVRLVDYKKKREKKKKGPSNDKLSEGTSQYADTWRDLHIIFNCSCFTSLGCLLPRPWGRHLALMFHEAEGADDSLSFKFIFAKAIWLARDTCTVLKIRDNQPSRFTFYHTKFRFLCCDLCPCDV